MTTYNGVEKFVFADVYNLFVKYKDIPNEDYYWGKLKEDCNILKFKYGDIDFISNMLETMTVQLKKRVSNKEEYNTETNKVGKLLNKELGR